jgi:hypothetical protein
MDSLFTPVSYQIWKERNTHCQRFPTTLNDLLSAIKAEADRWIQVDATGLGCLVAGGSGYIRKVHRLYKHNIALLVSRVD